MTDSCAYFDYLRRCSLKGRFYRRLWLYPRLCRYLKGRALDIGCGLGDMLAFRPATIGVDINDKTVAWCKARGFEAYRMEPDVLPFEKDSFDSVILDNVLEHLSDPKPLLVEIKRVLKTGGLLVVGVPERKGFASDSDHKVFYGKAELQALMQEAGFSPKTLFYMPFRCSWLATRLRPYCLYGAFETQKSPSINPASST